MPEPSPSGASLEARDLLVGCVAANELRSLGQALRLVQSIRWFGGGLASTQVMVCVVGEPERSFRQACEAAGAEVRIVAPFPTRHRAADKLRFFPEAWESGREMLLLLDGDMVVVQDPLPWMRRGAFQARIAPLPTVTPEVFERVFRHFGLPLPPREHVNSFARTPTIRYCNAGMILVPADLARRIVPVWSEYDARLAGEIEILHPCERQCHQASLSLALAACPVPFEEAPAELNFPLNLSHLPAPDGHFLVDPAILHDHDRADPDGFLLHCPYPFAQVRIEAFNRRLRQEREGLSGRAQPLRESPVPRARAALPAAAPAAQVVVLGMHRSGTSALTALLQSMGLWAGEEGDFPPADDHNENGYWEHRGVWSIDEAILLTLGTGWSEVADLELSRLDEGVRSRLLERARAVVRDLDRHGPWVIKDPRLCVLFPFWRQILEHPFCVLTYREPLPVARSLAARDGFPLSYGIALWEKYTLDALASTRGLPRILLSHRELLANPQGTLRRLYGRLLRSDSPDLAHLRVPTAEEIATVLDPALVHHPHDPDTERAYLTPPQLALLDALADGSALDLDPVPPLSPGARELLGAHQDLLATTRSLSGRLAAQTDLVATLQQAREGLLATHQNVLAAHQSVLASYQSMLAAHQNEIAAHQGVIAAHQRELAAHQTTRAAHQRALSSAKELDALLAATLESRSWKIGRAITSVLARLRGRPRLGAPERRERLLAELQDLQPGGVEE